MQSSAVPSKKSQWEGIICGRSKYVKISQDSSSGIILVITLIGWGKMSLRLLKRPFRPFQCMKKSHMKLQALKELIEQREEDPSMVQLGQGWRL